MKCTQREAAIEAVKKVGMNQTKEIDENWFSGREKEYQMLMERMKVLERV